jgi:hypothetical protein
MGGSPLLEQAGDAGLLRRRPGFQGLARHQIGRSLAPVRGDLDLEGRLPRLRGLERTLDPRQLVDLGLGGVEHRCRPLQAGLQILW